MSSPKNHKNRPSWSHPLVLAGAPTIDRPAFRSDLKLAICSALGPFSLAGICLLMALHIVLNDHITNRIAVKNTKTARGTIPYTHFLIFFAEIAVFLFLFPALELIIETYQIIPNRSFLLFNRIFGSAVVSLFVSQRPKSSSFYFFFTIYHHHQVLLHDNSKQFNNFSPRCPTAF